MGQKAAKAKFDPCFTAAGLSLACFPVFALFHVKQRHLPAQMPRHVGLFLRGMSGVPAARLTGGRAVKWNFKPPRYVPRETALPSRANGAHRRSVSLNASSRRAGHSPDALRRSGARKRQSPEPSLPGAGRPALCITRDDFPRLALFLGKQRHPSRANATPVFHVKHRPARGWTYVCRPSARSSGTPVRSKAGMYFSSAEESSCTKPSSRPRAKRWSTTSSYSSCARRRSS